MKPQPVIKLRPEHDLVRQLIKSIGDDPDRPGLKETPDRVVRSWEKLFSGYKEDPQDYIKVFESEYDQIVSMRGIDFYSFCEHHMLPFFGKVSVAYLPSSGKVIGASKLARIINIYSRRLQIQEQMTQQIAECLQDLLDPIGVAVFVEGKHLCMMARGVEQQHAAMKTSCILGKFRDDPMARSEVISLLGM